ncbi:MAG: mobile mystery protein A [Alphaproteobacteria bacterium]|jgi:predicted DNA-binding mobile mystery protein A
MKPEIRSIARKNLQQKTEFLMQKVLSDVPPKGWIRAFREALGMTTYQLAKRLNVSQPAVIRMEKREKKKDISLALLEKAAVQLNCRLEYYLVPLAPIDEMIKERARKVAFGKMKAVIETMALEDQAVAQRDLKEQIEKMTLELINTADSKIWDKEND